MLRATLGAALALAIAGGTVAAAKGDAPASRCIGSCAPVVVEGYVDGPADAGAAFVLAEPQVVRARGAARRVLRRADSVDVVLRDSTEIVVRDDAGERAEVLPEELLGAVEAGVEMDARVTGRLVGPRRDPSVRARRVVVDVASLDDVLPAEDPSVDDPAADDPPADDAPPADQAPPAGDAGDQGAG